MKFKGKLETVSKYIKREQSKFLVPKNISKFLEFDFTKNNNY